MATSAQRIAELEQQIADLSVQMAELREHAIVLRTVEEMIVAHRTWNPPWMAAGRRAAPHLHLVDGAS
jgi:hypothetical protein